MNIFNNKSINMFNFFTFLIFTLIFQTTKAQQASPPENQFYNPRFSPPMAIIIVLLIAALIFMGIFSIYIRHCNENQTSIYTIRQTISMRRRAAAAARGLEDYVIKTFPTFSYAEVKDQRIVKGDLECAVCLNEFEDDEMLRLIPICDHVFHPECIDAWLRSHVTCPVCRANLDPGRVEEAAAVVEEAGEVIEEEERNGEVVIGVGFEEEEGSDRRERANLDLTRGGSLNRVAGRSWSIKKRRMFSFGKLRSHSTGHSLVVPGENLDRFTLRLPEGVRKELLNRNTSCVQRFQGEGSSRDGGITSNDRRIEIPDRASKSDRWGFLTRGLSIKSPKVGNNKSGSSSKSPRALVKMPSSKPKSSEEIETSLVQSDSMRAPI